MSAYSDLIISKSPRGYWRMGEASGNPQDSSGNGNHVLTLTGAGSLTYSQTGAIFNDANTAILFTSPIVCRIPDATSLDLADVWTMEAWVKRSAIGNQDAIISKQTGAYLLRFATDNTLDMLRSGTADIVHSTNTIADTTTWHHVVGTKNAATSKLYIDGVDVTGTVTNSTAVDNASELLLGADSSVPDDPFHGAMDEIAVYPTALSAASVLENYNMGKFGPATAPGDRIIVVRSGLRLG